MGCGGGDGVKPGCYPAGTYQSGNQLTSAMIQNGSAPENLYHSLPKHTTKGKRKITKRCIAGNTFSFLSNAPNPATTIHV